MCTFLVFPGSHLTWKKMSCSIWCQTINSRAVLKKICIKILSLHLKSVLSVSRCCYCGTVVQQWHRNRVRMRKSMTNWKEDENVESNTEYFKQFEILSSQTLLAPDLHCGFFFPAVSDMMVDVITSMTVLNCSEVLVGVCLVCCTCHGD